MHQTPCRAGRSAGCRHSASDPMNI
jgi:hypothetical protein